MEHDEKKPSSPLNPSTIRAKKKSTITNQEAVCNFDKKHMRFFCCSVTRKNHWKNAKKRKIAKFPVRDLSLVAIVP